MSTNLIPFDSGKLPARLQGRVVDNSALTMHVGNGFAVLSIKGKVFTLVKNQERKLITRPDDPDEAATSLELVILAANPNLSKVYYHKSFDDDAPQGKPDCYSNDGIKPAADAADPQCKTCAACPQAVWGSGANGKGKKCQDSRRIAVAAAGQINEPMMLRVPPASLKPLAEYARLLQNRNASFTDVVTKVRFDQEEATPKLVFKPVGFLDDDAVEEVAKIAASDTVQSILGLLDAPSEAFETAAPQRKSIVSDSELDAIVEPAKAVIEKAKAVDEAPAKAPKTKAPDEAPAKVAKAKTTTVVDDLDEMLASLPDD